MGLSVTVGVLADLLEHDEEGAGWVKGHFTEVNDLLRANGFEKHSEPEKCEIWSADGYGYSGLHALREVAGIVWMGKRIPRDILLTGQDKTCGDKLFDAALPMLLGGEKKGWFSRLVRSPQKSVSLPFLHLVAHSDAEGYYVPIDFPLPLTPNVMQKETATLWPLGSVQQLSKEVTVLKGHLEIPNDLKSQSDDLIECLEAKKPKADGALWEAQPIATYSALVLKEACDAAMRTGASISFG